MNSIRINGCRIGPVSQAIPSRHSDVEIPGFIGARAGVVGPDSGQAITATERGLLLICDQVDHPVPRDAIMAWIGSRMSTKDAGNTVPSVLVGAAVKQVEELP